MAGRMVQAMKQQERLRRVISYAVCEVCDCIEELKRGQ